MSPSCQVPPRQSDMTAPSTSASARQYLHHLVFYRRISKGIGNCTTLPTNPALWTPISYPARVPVCLILLLSHLGGAMSKQQSPRRKTTASHTYTHTSTTSRTQYFGYYTNAIPFFLALQKTFISSPITHRLPAPWSGVGAFYTRPIHLLPSHAPLNEMSKLQAKTSRLRRPFCEK